MKKNQNLAFDRLYHIFYRDAFLSYKRITMVCIKLTELNSVFFISNNHF